MKKILVSGLVMALSLLASAQVTNTGTSSSERNKDYKDSNFIGGFFIEPGLFYEQGRGQYSSEGGLVDFGGDLKEIGIGLRVGGHLGDIVFLGLDAAYNEPAFSSSLYSTRARSVLAGLTGGIQTPFAGVRLWGTYYPYGTLDQNKSQGLQMSFSEPDMWKIGAGVRIATLSLNLEYLTGTYRKSSVENDGSEFVTFEGANARRDSWLLGLSFPFAL